MKRFRKYAGFSIVEISIALGIFVLLVGSVSIFSIDAVTFIQNQNLTINANIYANQMLNSILSYKSADWDSFVSLTDQGSKHLYIPEGSTGWKNSDDFMIYRKASGMELINSGPVDITWDTPVADGDSFTVDSTSADITVNKKGFYLLMYSLHTESGGGSGKNGILSWVKLNDKADLPYGVSHGLIARTHNSSTAYNQATTILNLDQGDSVKIQAKKTGSNTAAVRRRGGKSGIVMIKLDDTYDYLMARTSSATSIPSNSSFVPVDFNLIDQTDVGTYEKSSTGVLLKKRGHYLITYNIGIEHSNTSIQVTDESRLLLGNEEIDASRVSTYSHDASGNSVKGVMSWGGIIETDEPNQLLSLQVREQSTTNPPVHTVIPSETGITIVKLPDHSDFVRLGEVQGGQPLTSQQEIVTWDEILQMDSGSFQIDPSTPGRVVIKSAGNYLFFHSIYLEKPPGSSTFETPFLEWRGKAGPYAYGSSGQLNRGDLTNITRISGSSSGFIANDLVDMDYIELVQSNESDEGSSTLTGRRMGLQGVNLNTLIKGSTEQDYFSVVDGEKNENGIRSSFTVTPVSRDANQNIVSSGGSVDPFSRKITLFLSWEDSQGKSVTRTIETYVNYWDVQKYIYTTEVEFLEGDFDRTKAVNEEDGEVVLDESVISDTPSWCGPDLLTSYYNINGNGIAMSVFSEGNFAYMGTGGNASGDAFSKLHIQGLNDANLQFSFIGSWDSEKVNSIVNEGNYAHMTTDTNSQEVIILKHDTSPYSVVGYVDAPGSTDGNAIYVSGSYGYFGQGRTLRIYDNSIQTGKRPILGSVVLGSSTAIIIDLVVRGNYAFVGVGNDNYELFIVDVTNKSNPQIVNSISVNSVNTRELYVSEDGTKIFLLTQFSALEPEFFLIDSTSKTGTLPIIHAMDITTMRPTSLAVVEASGVFIIAGERIGNNDNYLVFRYENGISECGGLHVSSNINDIAATTIWDSVNSTMHWLTYALTTDKDKEFRVVAGTSSDSQNSGGGYYTAGRFDSKPFESGSPLIRYKYFTWEEERPEDTDIWIQFRGGATVEELNNALYVGPDGTAETFYSNSNYGQFPAGFNGSRYIQFVVFMSSDDPEVTPILKSINVYFER